MAKKTFDIGDTLAAALGNVSDYDQSEQITYIDVALLDEDVENFYSMDGIEELAANIELIGLQQPLRVRANPEAPDRYLIVSGHRRRKAIGLLYKDDPQKWAKVACIVEQTAASPELQELRLIMANADTRRMSSADLAKQVERVQVLLYKLKEQGVIKFSGRMRDAVAEACKVSSTKLAVLAAIRGNLIPELQEYYEKNKINESAAYELQKLPADGQKAIADSCKRTGADFITGIGAEHCVKYAQAFMNLRRCPDGEVCGYREQRFVQVLRAKYCWAQCTGGCCLECKRSDCERPCKKARAKNNEEKEKRKEEKEKQEKEEKKRQEKIQKEKRAERQKQAQRVLPLIEAAGLKDSDELEGNAVWYKTKVETIRKAASGEFGEKTHFYGNDHYIIPTSAEGLTKWADTLGCSTDYLLGRTDEKEPWAKTPWIACEEKDPDEGTFVFACTRDGVVIPSVYFRARFMDFTERSVANNEIKRVQYWLPLPAMPDGKKWQGQEILEELTRK